MSCGKFKFNPKFNNESLQLKQDKTDKQLILHCKLNKKLTKKQKNMKQAIKRAKKEGIITESQGEDFYEIHHQGNRGKHSFHN